VEFDFYLPDTIPSGGTFTVTARAYITGNQVLNVRAWDYGSTTPVWVDTGVDIPAGTSYPATPVTLTLGSRYISPYTNKVRIEFNDNEGGIDNARNQSFVDYIALTYTWTDHLPADLTLIGYPGTKFGWSIANLGDIDGDGTTDIGVGAPGFDSNRGAVYIYKGDKLDGAINYSGSKYPDSELVLLPGAETDVETQVCWASTVICGGSYGDQFGYAISSAGVQGTDGCCRIAVGAPFNDTNGINAGAVYFFDIYNQSGVVYTLHTGEAERVYLGFPGAQLGAALNFTGGDLDQYGGMDIVVGIPLFSSAGTTTGGAHAVSYVAESTGTMAILYTIIAIPAITAYRKLHRKSRDRY